MLFAKLSPPRLSFFVRVVGGITIILELCHSMNEHDLSENTVYNAQTGYCVIIVNFLLR